MGQAGGRLGSSGWGGSRTGDSDWGEGTAGGGTATFRAISTNCRAGTTPVILATADTGTRVTQVTTTTLGLVSLVVGWPFRCQGRGTQISAGAAVVSPVIAAT